jgi:hypothetical protein
MPVVMVAEWLYQRTKVEAFSQAVMALAHFSITLLGLLVDPWRSHKLVSVSVLQS